MEKNNDDNQELFSHFGYQLLRNDLLQELLGKDLESILYWSGKSLARKYPQTSLDSICDFFQEACFGELKVIKESNQERRFLFSPSTSLSEQSYRLEAGFLAEQVQQLIGCTSETKTTVKKNLIMFTVQSDLKDPIR